MTEIKSKALSLLSSAYKACRDTVTEAIQAVVYGFTWLYRWHQRLLRTNPGYPKALLTIGKTLIRVLTPSGTVATAAVALLAAMLEVQHQDPEDDWHEYY